MAGFLPLIQSPLETTPQPVMAHALQVEELTTACALQVKELTTTHALQAGITQSLLGTVPRTTHRHPTHPTGVKVWVENQVLWCNAHYVQVGARMAELAALQLMQLVGT